MSTAIRTARSLERRCWPLLLALCRRDAAEFLAGAPDRSEEWGIAWEGLARLAARHGVLGLVLEALDRAGRIGDGKDGSLSPFVPVLARLRRRAALIEMKRDRAVAVLREAGIEPVMLKGSALAETLYESPAERAVLDIDLLVPEERLKPAVRALAAAGYASPSSRRELGAFRKHHFHIPMDTPGSPTVEVHWDLSRPDDRFRLDGRAVLERSVDFVRRGHQVFRVPSAEHMLLHLVLQNVHEGFTRLGRIVDIDRIVDSTPSLEWPALSMEARKGNLAPALALSLGLARSLLGASVPRAALADLRPGAVSRFHLGELHAFRAAPSRMLIGQTGKRLLQIWLLPTAGGRLGMLLGLLGPAPLLPSMRASPGFPRRVSGLAKLAAIQAAVGGAALALLVTPFRRGRFELWSG